MASAAVQAALRAAVPGAAGAGVALALPDARHPERLAPAELASVGAQVSRHRLEELALGRAAARAALADLGVAPSPVAVGPGGAPVWPPRLVGSIAHTRGVAVAVVAPETSCGGLGVDVEAAGRTIADRALARLLAPGEREALPGLEALALFCAKEAAWKALQHASRPPPGLGHVRLLAGTGPDDVRATVDADESGPDDVRATVDADESGPAAVAHVRLLGVEGLLLALAALP